MPATAAAPTAVRWWKYLLSACCSVCALCLNLTLGDRESTEKKRTKRKKKNGALNSCSTHRSTRSSNNIRKKRRRGIFIHSFHLLCSISSQLRSVGNLMIFFSTSSSLFTLFYSFHFSSFFVAVAATAAVAVVTRCILFFRATFVRISVPFSWSSTAKCCFVLWIFLQRKLFASL